jgi:hypothetical protein
LAKWRAEVIAHVAVIWFTVGVSSSCADCYPQQRKAGSTLVLVRVALLSIRHFAKRAARYRQCCESAIGKFNRILKKK